MACMRREFSLVLLGTGLLSAGFFFIPEPAASKAPRALRRPRDNTLPPTRRVAAPVPVLSDQLSVMRVERVNGA